MSLLRKTGVFRIYEKDGHLRPRSVEGTIESVGETVLSAKSKKKLIRVDIRPSDGSPTITAFVLKDEPAQQ